MGLTRRRLIAGAIAGAGLAAAQERRSTGPRVRTTPPICVYTQVLIKVGYDELGPILRDLGVDGANISVHAGGHVDPQKAPVDMSRSIEAITGVGLDVPVITTEYTTLNDPTIRNVCGISGSMGVPLFRSGTWKYGPGDIEARLSEVQRDIAGLAALARAANMTVAIPNMPGDYVGASVWDLQSVIRTMDPRSVGFDFDPGYAAQGAGPGATSIPLRLVLSRIKMVTLRDFNWSKDSGAWKAVPCALGEGVVNFQELFAALARMRFVGPISIQQDYQPRNELTALRRDIDFAIKQRAAAYGG